MLQIYFEFTHAQHYVNAHSDVNVIYSLLTDKVYAIYIMREKVDFSRNIHSVIRKVTSSGFKLSANGRRQVNYQLSKLNYPPWNALILCPSIIKKQSLHV